MENIFGFFPVGQGLFYGGCIGIDETPFRIVYDCGSASGAKGVYPALDRYTHLFGSDPIDLLVLSHFHFDHFCGIRALLEGRRARMVVMPYFTPYDRLILAKEIVSSEFDGEEIDQWLAFCKSPRAFLSDYAERVVFLQDPEQREYDEEFGERTRETAGAEFRWDDLFEARGTYYRMTAPAVRIARPDWEFFFCRSHPKREITERRKAAIEAACGGRSPEDILRDGNLKTILNAIGKRKLKIDENTDSVMLYHAPADRRMHALQGCTMPTCFPCAVPHSFSMRTGTLLTGDTDLTAEWGDLADALEWRRDNIGVFQVPHHGAKSAFDDYRFDVCAVSYGLKNSYGHPAAETLKKIASCGCELKFVNEYLGFFYRIG